MAVSTLSPLSLTPIFDNNGALVRNAKIYFYRPNTFDPITVYQDQELGAPHTQPILTGGSGRVPPVYVGPDDYRVRIFDNANQLVEDVPFLPGATESTGGGGGSSSSDLATGDVIWRFSNGGVRSGFVRLNGGTIGSGLSGATERANDDAYDLFQWLWGQDTDELLPVLPSRGASAESDWLANKQLTLPDGAGMVLGGISGMGRPARTTLAGVPFSLGTAATVGARCGEALHVTTINEMPAHAHGITDPGHTHAASQPAHVHGVNDPTHAHTIYDPGHVHGVADPGHSHYVNDPGHNHTVNQSGHRHTYSRPNSVLAVSLAAGALRIYQEGLGSYDSGSTDPSVSAVAALTGIWLSGSGTGISIHNAGTGIGIYGAATGISIQAAQPAITVNGAATGIAVNSQGGGAGHNTVQPTLLGTWYMKL